MRRLTLTELQAYLTDALVAFDTYCRAHDIRYSLCGGTLIGAVRHGGWIPWDDDIDVMMTRSEYRRLTRCWQRDPDPKYVLLTDTADAPAFAAESGKWYAAATAPTAPDDDYDIGLFMDIFVADGLPDAPDAAQAHLDTVHRLGRRYHSMYKRRHRPFWRLLQRLVPSLRPARIYERLTREITRYDDTQPHVALLLGSGHDLSREMMPREYFDEFVDLDFAGHPIRAIAAYDDYLRRYYGDYMQLPPESERRSYHTRNHILKRP